MMGQNISIYQIYYQPKHRWLLDPAFIPYDNAAALAPFCYEFDVFKRFYETGLHLQQDMLGALSWKFKEKTGLQGSVFVDFIQKNPRYDVYFVNPYLKLCRFPNVWIQGEKCHPRFIEFTQEILNQVGYNIDLQKVRNTVETTAFCNYWVGNAVFWQKYMTFTLPVYQYILYDSPPDLRQVILYQRACKKIRAPYLPFIFERLFSLLLAVDPSIKSLRIPALRSE